LPRASQTWASLRDRCRLSAAYAPLMARLARSPLAQQQPSCCGRVRTRGRHQRQRHAGVAGAMFRACERRSRPADGREVVLFADTFNRTYERENLDAALRVLVAGGYRVHIPKPADHGRPLCCGRTFLSAGLVDHARTELDRWSRPTRLRRARRAIVGLEPSCLLTLRDELLSLRSDETAKSISAHALLFEEFLVREAAAGHLALSLGPIARQGARARPLSSEIVRRIQIGRAGVR